MVVIKGLKTIPEKWQNDCHMCPFFRYGDMSGPDTCILKCVVHDDALWHSELYFCPLEECPDR